MFSIIMYLQDGVRFGKISLHLIPCMAPRSAKVTQSRKIGRSKAASNAATSLLGGPAPKAIGESAAQHRAAGAPATDTHLNN